MRAFDRLRVLFARRGDRPDADLAAHDAAPGGVPEVVASVARELDPGSEVAEFDEAEETRLWTVLREDPNDVVAFAALAEVVRRRAAQGHPVQNRAKAADDAVWSLAEELAHSGRAWFPLVELARLSVHDDRETALRRLATAAERDPSGDALATGLLMLRDAGLPDDALNLGVGHWRPREHDLEAGRQLVEAAVEAGRTAEARRHLQALGMHPDAGRAAALRAELERLIAAGAPGRTPARGVPVPVAPLRPQDLATSDTPGPGYGTGPATGPIHFGPALVDVREDVVDLTAADEQTPPAAGAPPQRRLFRRP